MTSLSYAEGGRTWPLVDKTVGAYFERVVLQHGDRDALIAGGYRASYRKLWEDSGRVARALLAAGIAKGERVGIWSPNCAEWVLVQLAAARVGAVLVCVNPGYDEDEGEFALKLAGVNLLFVRASFQGVQYPAWVKAMRERLPELRRLVVIGREARFERVLPNGWSEFLDAAETIDDTVLAEREASISHHDPHHIQFTSGTTGRPKGVVLSHHNILNNARMIAKTMRYSERDRACLGSQLYHTMGNTFGVLACIAEGAALVLPSEVFDPLATIAAIHEHECTSFIGTPTMYIAMLGHVANAPDAFATMRTGIMAGAPCPFAVMKRVTTEMHVPELTICYGMTETSPVSCQTRIDDSLEQRVTTVGAAHPHVEIAIKDPRTNEIVPRGVPGEFCARGYHVMLGYFRNGQATLKAVHDGWMHTGDVAIMGEDGYIQVKGRIKDTIYRNGVAIYPRDIEEQLYRHPAVADVQVIGVPNAAVGEQVMALVKLKPGHQATFEELAARCRANMPSSWVPTRWKLVDGFPTNMAGKIMKYILRDMIAQEDRQLAVGA